MIYKGGGIAVMIIKTLGKLRMKIWKEMTNKIEKQK